MARANEGILGPFYGKVGPVVGSRWKGINYVRSLPRADEKKKKLSVAQLAHQERFKFMSKWLAPLNPYVTVGFTERHLYQTEINQAFKFNYQHALEGVYPNFSINYSEVLVSKGQLAPPVVQELEVFLPRSLAISWEAQSGGRAAHDDQVMLVLMATTLGIADGVVGMAKRSDGLLIYDYPARLSGHEVAIYLSFIGLNRRKASNSTYLGRRVLP